MTENKPKNWVEFLRTVKYKPNWTFEHVYEIDFDEEYLLVMARVPDVYNPSQLTTITMRRFLETDSFDVERASLMIRSLIHEMEIHEADEFLTIDGVREFDPHKWEKEWEAKRAAANQGV